MAERKNNKAKAFLTKMVELLDDMNTSMLSDRDMFYLVNSYLSKEERISMSYFEFLKSPNQNNKRSISNNQSFTDEEKEDFINAINVGRVKQKMNLTEKAFDDKLKNAYPYLWTLERKNTDLRLNNAPVASNQPLIQITASNDEHKALINNILSGEPIHLQPAKEKEVPISTTYFTEITPEDSINPQIGNE